MSVPGLIILVLVWSGVLWGAARLVCQLNPRPHLAQAIWRAAAILMVTPFLAALFMPALQAPEVLAVDVLAMREPHFVAPGTAVLPGAAVASFKWPSLTEVLIGMLALGWATRIALWVLGQIRLQHVKGRSCGVVRPVAHWAQAMDLARVPEVRMIQGGSPFLAGLVRPIIFVPAALLDRQDACPIIVHEMVHLKRGDLLTRPLERLLADLFWFSPFVWMIRERLDYWREAVVDDETARLTGDPIAYAKALSRAARLSSPVRSLPVAALNLPRKGTLKMRLSQLLDSPPTPSGRIGLAMATAFLFAVPLALAQGTLIKGEGGAMPTKIVYSHPVLDKAKLTSAFGMRPDPFTKQVRLHNGTDLAGPMETPIYAPTEGVVVFAGRKSGYGNLVQLQVSAETALRFAQLDSVDVEVGENVRAGDVIGLMGRSGRATGPHLHLEVLHNGAPRDPEAEDGLVLAGELHETAKPMPPRAPEPPAPAAPPRTNACASACARPAASRGARTSDASATDSAGQCTLGRGAASSRRS